MFAKEKNNINNTKSHCKLKSGIQFNNWPIMMLISVKLNTNHNFMKVDDNFHNVILQNKFQV